MSQIAAVAIAQAGLIPVKPSINPGAFYTYQELEELKLGKYLKFRRAIKRGAFKAHYAGQNVLIKGENLLAFLKGSL